MLQLVPEVAAFANLELRVVFNKDSSNVGPTEWAHLARLLDRERDAYDAFLIIHGTDTMAFTAAALSLMLVRCAGLMAGAAHTAAVEASNVVACRSGSRSQLC